MKKIKSYLPQDTRKFFFNYYIKPHLDYCSSVWGQTSEENLNAINKLQKQLAKLILDKDYSTPSSKMFKELQLLTFPKNVHCQHTLLVYKSLNNFASPYMREMFQYVNDVSKVNLRSAVHHKLYVSRAHSKTFQHSGPKV